jgi:hypothetical protein
MKSLGEPVHRRAGELLAPLIIILPLVRLFVNVKTLLSVRFFIFFQILLNRHLVFLTSGKLPILKYAHKRHRTPFCP